MIWLIEPARDVLWLNVSFNNLYISQSYKFLCTSSYYGNRDLNPCALIETYRNVEGLL